jgi:hypothetical protein
MRVSVMALVGAQKMAFKKKTYANPKKTASKSGKKLSIVKRLRGTIAKALERELEQLSPKELEQLAERIARARRAVETPTKSKKKQTRGPIRKRKALQRQKKKIRRKRGPIRR